MQWVCKDKPDFLQKSCYKFGYPLSWERPNITVSKTGAHTGRRLNFPGLVAQLWCSPEAAAHKPLIFPCPDDDPTALSPSKKEAKREAKKCSGYVRINLTFSRSLGKSLVIRYPGNTPKSQFRKQVIVSQLPFSPPKRKLKGKPRNAVGM